MDYYRYTRKEPVIERIRGLMPESRRDKRVSSSRTSRRDKELRQRRFLYIVMAVVTVATVALLAGGSIWEFVIQPRQTLASVNGTAISRGDYWKYRRYSLLQQIQQYQFFAGQDPQYQTYVQQLQGQLTTVKSAPTDPATLTTMIDDRLTVQRAESLGVTISDADLNTYIQETFAPVPLNTPTVTPTINPTASAWAAQTATARAITPTTAATPGAAGTPGAATPGTPGTPAATPGTPETAGTPGTPTVSPTVAGSATPDREQALATSTASFGTFVTNLQTSTGMSQADYLRLIARPELAKQRVTDTLTSQVKDVQPQVHAFHLLVATKDGADQVRAAIAGGKSFGDAAKEQSTDTATAPNGGDLGWVPRGVMVREFEDAAFALQPGQISEPVQTKFGWHVITVTEREEARPLTTETFDALKQSAYTKWLDGQKTSAAISSDLPATPTPTRSQFEVPPDAPPTAVPTPLPTPTRPASTPGAGGTRTATP